MRFYKHVFSALIVLILLVSYSATAQNGVTSQPLTPVLETAADPAKNIYGLTIDPANLPEIRKQIADMEMTDKDAKAKLLDIYDKTIAIFKQLQVTKEETSGFTKRIENIPADLAKNKEQLAQSIEESFPANTDTMPLGDVQKEAASAQSLLEETKSNSAALENEPKRRAERRTNIPVESAAAKEQLAQMKEKLPAAPAESNVSDLAFAGRLLQVVQIMALEAKIENLSTELKLYDAAGDLLTSRRELAARGAVQAEKKLKFWQDQLTAAQKRETEKLKEKSKETVQQAKYAHPVIQKLAQENAELVNTQAELIKQMDQVNKYSKTIETSLADLDSDFTNLKKEIESSGEITGVMGVLLLSKRQEIQDTAPNREKIKDRLVKISSAKLNWSKYDKQWSGLVDVETFAKIRLQEDQLKEEDVSYETVYKEAVKLLEDRRRDVRKIADYYEDLSTTLARLDVKERKLVSTVKDYKAYIDKNILWIISSNSVTIADLKLTGKALRWLLLPDNWVGIFRHLWDDFKHQSASYLGIVIISVLLWIYRLNISKRLEKTSRLTEHVYSDKYLHTVKALVYSIIIIIPLPLLTGFLSYNLLQSTRNQAFAHIIGQSLLSVSVLLLLINAFMQFLRKNGLSDHFSLPRESMNAFSRSLRSAYLFIVPVVFLRLMFSNQGITESYRFSLGRILFVTEMIAVSVFFMFTFRPSGNAVGILLREKHGSWLYRTRHLWYGSLVILPILFGILHLLGYDYTAGQLYNKFLATILLFFAIMFLKIMLTRWLKLTHNRLLLSKKAREKHLKATKDTNTDIQPKTEKALQTHQSEEEEEQQIENISQQTLSLVNSISALAVLIGIWLIWENILPALSALENIGIWDTTDSHGATVVINLGNIFMAILILVMTVAAARNAPGLMEIVILQRLPLDHGVRFAISSLSRYTIVVVGIIMTFGQIGIGWAKVQWLIAAMTVGLGFGLQEIFANFVSGLIILFEQPIRVGDAVTVGDVNGTVSKIKIRATTIRKWDQKELIVPNREFITGRLINWSLSDRTLRMEFPVGVAYGSDIKKTEETLYRVAHNQKGVIKDDPGPKVVFRSFGDSCLDFELRVYIPNMDNYLAIWHEINCAIDTEFRKEGIEIAFPQRDLHIRSVEAPFPVQMNPKIDG